jgi:hypothetical protein
MIVSGLAGATATTPIAERAPLFLSSSKQLSENIKSSHHLVCGFFQTLTATICKLKSNSKSNSAYTIQNPRMEFTSLSYANCDILCGVESFFFFLLLLLATHSQNSKNFSLDCPAIFLGLGFRA